MSSHVQSCPVMSSRLAITQVCTQRRHCRPACAAENPSSRDCSCSRSEVDMTRTITTSIHLCAKPDFPPRILRLQLALPGLSPQGAGISGFFVSEWGLARCWQCSRRVGGALMGLDPEHKKKTARETQPYNLGITWHNQLKLC